MADLLLHSLKEFDEVIFGVLNELQPKSVLEIGSETGQFSQMLMDFCKRNQAELVVVEPAPNQALVELAVKDDSIFLFVGTSIGYFDEVGCRTDFAIIDGDHNYYTVSRELAAIRKSWDERGASGVMLLHDVGYPCARRDCYYAPQQIPAESCHPHSYAHGVGAAPNSLLRGGFRGEGAFAWALHEGGERNGVLTAVEDFLRENPSYSYRSVDAVFGLGAVAKKGSREEEVVTGVFSRYDNALIRRLEKNRFELYVKVIELQDLLNARAQQAKASAAR